MRDFCWRCLSAIVINVVGFWWPTWYMSRIPPEIDSRVGIVFVYTLPCIVVAGFWATMAFRWAYRPRCVSVGLLLLVWAPALIVGTRIILLVLYVADLLHHVN